MDGPGLSTTHWIRGSTSSQARHAGTNYSIPTTRRPHESTPAGVRFPISASLACRAPSSGRRVAAIGHKIKDDGFRLLTRRGASGVRLFTGNGHVWTEHFPLIHESYTSRHMER